MSTMSPVSSMNSNMRPAPAAPSHQAACHTGVAGRTNAQSAPARLCELGAAGQEVFAAEEKKINAYLKEKTSLFSKIVKGLTGTSIFLTICALAPEIIPTLAAISGVYLLYALVEWICRSVKTHHMREGMEWGDKHLPHHA